MSFQEQTEIDAAQAKVEALRENIDQNAQEGQLIETTMDGCRRRIHEIRQQYNLAMLDLRKQSDGRIKRVWEDYDRHSRDLENLEWQKLFLSKRVQNLERFITLANERKILGAPLDLRKFPPEIRREIFKLCLVEDNPIHDLNRCQETPPIFRASQWTFKETHSIYYGQNKFVLSDLRREFPQSIKQHIAYLTLHIDKYTDDIQRFLSSLQFCESLKVLHIFLANIPEGLEQMTFNKPNLLCEISIKSAKSLHKGVDREKLKEVCKSLENKLYRKIRKSGRIEAMNRRNV